MGVVDFFAKRHQYGGQMDNIWIQKVVEQTGYANEAHKVVEQTGYANEAKHLDIMRKRRRDRDRANPKRRVGAGGY